uniref:ARAD1D00286p n=1 Tax=Blastobotrys adeninivorans TaxID=409370 RepID=A0A060T7K9_BLAAD
MTLTQSQRDALIRNLEVEMDNRIRRLRAQHHLAAKALRAKIEMRINRVPKRLWTKTLAEIAQQEQNKVNGHESFDLSAGSTVGLYENPIAGRVLAKPVDSAKLLVPKVRKVSKTSKSPVKGMIKQTFRSLSNRARSPLKTSNGTTTNATNTTNYLSPTKSTAASQKPTSTSASRTNSTVKQNIEKFTLLSEDGSTTSNGRRLRKGPAASTASSDRKEEPLKRTTRTRRKPPTTSTTTTAATTTTTATNPSRATAPTAASARRNLRNRGE